MHPSAFAAGRHFFEIYRQPGHRRVLDVGAMNINGSLRACAPADMAYLGIDIAGGPGVDQVVEAGSPLPFADDSFDLIVSTSCFEHDQFFWVSFLEILRVLKPGGYFLLNAPSNGHYHSYPGDNWRFYPDAGLALVAWARREGRDAELIESAILPQIDDQWNDFMAVFRKPAQADAPPPAGRISARFPGAANMRRLGSPEVENLTKESEDQRRASLTSNNRATAQQDIFVVIPFYKRRDQLDRCIARLRAQSTSARLRIYVRDNSQDNLFFTGAVNEGLRHGLELGGVRYYLLLNQDCYLEPTAIENLVAFMDRNPRAGICGPLQRNSEGAITWAGSVDAFPFGQHLTLPPTDASGRMGSRPTPWVTGAAMLLRAQTLRDCGVLDPHMAFICSDADYCFTARSRGWECHAVGLAECIHEGGASTDFNEPGTRERKLLDMKYFCEKWLTGRLYRRLATEGPKLTPDYVDLVYRNVLEQLGALTRNRPSSSAAG